MFFYNCFLVTLLSAILIASPSKSTPGEIIVPISSNGPVSPTISKNSQNNGTADKGVETGGTFPLPMNPLAVTSTSFKLLLDKLGVEYSITYACGVTLKVQTFVNTTLLQPVGVPTPVPVPVVHKCHKSEIEEPKIPGVPGPAEELIKLNPIVIIGSTCIPGFCASYNVNQNTLSTSGE